MNESEKLELAEFNHSCSKKNRDLATGSGGESECQMFCHAKECCPGHRRHCSMQQTSTSESSSGIMDNPDDDIASFDMLKGLNDPADDAPDTWDSYGGHPTIIPSRPFTHCQRLPGARICPRRLQIST